MKKKHAVPVAFIALTLALTACAGNGNESAPDDSGDAGDQITEVSVGYIPAGVYAYFWQADEAGYFAEEGISIELTAMAGGSEIIPALQSDSVQFGISDAMGLINARSQGIEVEYATFNAGQTSDSPIHSVVVADDSITTGSDLNGLTVATNSTFNTDWIMMRKWLVQGGADLDSINFVEMSFPDQLAALRAGTIDAAGMLEPYVTSATNEDLLVIGNYFTDVESPVSLSGVLVMSDYAAENPELVTGFVRAIERAVDDFNENPDLAREVIAANTEIDPALVAEMNLPMWSNDLDPAMMQFWIDAALDEGIIEEPLDPAELLWQP